MGQLSLWGIVCAGHGRGSRELGYPTANIDPQQLEPHITALPAGVYFG